MILNEISNLILTCEEGEFRPTFQSNNFNRPSDDGESFIKKHKKKLLGAAAIGATIYAAKRGMLPQPLQATADNIGHTASMLTTDASNRLRKATGQTTIGDIFTDRETTGGYLRNKLRMFKNVIGEPHV